MSCPRLSSAGFGPGSLSTRHLTRLAQCQGQDGPGHRRPAESGARGRLPARRSLPPPNRKSFTSATDSLRSSRLFKLQAVLAHEAVLNLRQPSPAQSSGACRSPRKRLGGETGPELVSETDGARSFGGRGAKDIGRDRSSAVLLKSSWEGGVVPMRAAALASDPHAASGDIVLRPQRGTRLVGLVRCRPRPSTRDGISSDVRPRPSTRDGISSDVRPRPSTRDGISFRPRPRARSCWPVRRAPAGGRARRRRAPLLRRGQGHHPRPENVEVPRASSRPRTVPGA